MNYSLFCVFAPERKKTWRPSLKAARKKSARICFDNFLLDIRYPDKCFLISTEYIKEGMQGIWRVLTRYVQVSMPIKLSHGRVTLLYARPASEQLWGISLVTRQPIEFPTNAGSAYVLFSAIIALHRSVVCNKQLKAVFPKIGLFSSTFVLERQQYS